MVYWPDHVLPAYILPRVSKKLAAIANTPDRLENERQRFAMSPQQLRYSSSPSGVSTSETDRLKQRQFNQLEMDYLVTRASYQFGHQRSLETDRLCEEENMDRDEVAVWDKAADNVKKRWEKQGIWDPNWVKNNPSFLWTWKHEEPMIFEEITEKRVPGGRSQKRSRKKRKGGERVSSDDRQREWSEVEPDAARPFNQFIYQVSEECKRTESVIGSNVAASKADIYTKAYKTIRKAWVEQNLWDARWAILPGKSWRHEENRDDYLKREMARLNNPPQAHASSSGGHEHVGASPCTPSSVGSACNIGPNASAQSWHSDVVPNRPIPGPTDLPAFIFEGGKEAGGVDAVPQTGRAEAILSKPTSVAGSTSNGGREAVGTDASPQPEAHGKKKSVQRRQRKARIRRQSTKGVAADQNNGDNLPCATRLRPRTAQGRVRRA